MSDYRIPFGVGIIGSGWVSGEHIKAYNQNPRTIIKGLYTRVPEKGRQKLAEYNTDATVFESLDEMLADPEISIISVCSSPDVHCEHVIKIAQAKKHIVIEKPLAMNYADAKRMEAAVNAAGVKTVVSFVLRWNPMFVTTKELLRDDAVGRVMYLECDYWHWIGPHYPQYPWAKTKAAGGDSLLSAGCHAVDALRWFGGEIKEVTGYSAAGFTGSDYEFDPNIVAILKFENGAIGKVASMLECKTPYVFNINILGETGSIRNNRVFSHKYPGASNYLEYPTILPDSGDVTHHPFKEEIDHFVDVLTDGGDCICGIADAIKTMEVCYAIQSSVESGGPVRLPLGG
jgi:predicted dehydrogenase